MSHPNALFFGWVVGYIVALSIAPYASDPIFEVDILADDEALQAPSDPVDRSGNTWEKACELLSDECKLSPREREVFGMLAHGRNVEHIAETLFISTNTAKTHKYRIYRKLEVSTQQQMLDRIEDAERKILTQ